MKSQFIVITFFLFCAHAYAEEICHFTKAEIPRSEARLLELARVIEFRTDAILPQAQVDKANGTSQYIAERYQAGKCVSRQSFSLGVHSKDELIDGSYKGIMSFGWHMDNQKLVGVNDTGYFHQTGFASLPEFHTNRPDHWVFFKDSKAEPRASNGGLHFKLYPILAIRGSKPMAFADGLRLGHAFYELPSEQLTNAFKQYPDAVIVYLSFGAGLPELNYDQTKAE